ncbi:MAG: thioredoxin domain-containing protein, partial [Patescibacteria group bacterium]
MSDKISIPLSIIVAGLLIGGGFYLNGRNKINNQNSLGASSIVQEQIKQAANIRPVDANDHILGNPSAPVVIIEYSDTECPFCKEFHKTMRALMTEYGNKGNLAWVYRHFPFEELHPKALKEAEALECVGELGGNSKFWEYTNRLYEVTPSNNDIDPKELTNIAKQVGLSSDKFNTCLESGQYAPRVKTDV